MNSLPTTYWDRRREEKQRLKKRFLAAVNAHVRPLGFAGSEKALAKSFPSGNLAVIHFQVLSSTDKAEVRPSIGVASARLARAMKPDQKRISREMHVGVFARDCGKDLIDFPLRGDSSLFELRSDEEADLAADQMNRFLDIRGFKWMEDHSEDSTILKELEGAKGIPSDWAAILSDILAGRPLGTTTPYDPWQTLLSRSK